MDIFAHAIWSAVAYSGQPRRRAVSGILWGVLPDLIPASASVALIPVMGISRTGFAAVYPFTHSLVIFAVAFGLTALVRRAVPWPMLAWALHILVDIPGHQRFLTPFLFPLSDYRIYGGWEWLSVPGVIANYSAIALTVAVLWRRRRTQATLLPAEHQPVRASRLAKQRHSRGAAEDFTASPAEHQR